MVQTFAAQFTRFAKEFNEAGGCACGAPRVRYCPKAFQTNRQLFQPMAQENSSVADLFRRAQALRRERPQASYKEIKEQLVKEFTGQPFPSLLNLTIPEQDARAPEEDWTAGLPLVRRGIQFQDWKEIANGIILSLEQTENYESQRGPEGDRDDWHDRSVGIEEPTKKAIGKWMPEELMKLAERNVKK
jgi:hypothetical protein